MRFVVTYICMEKESKIKTLRDSGEYMKSAGLPSELIELLTKRYGMVLLTDATKAAIEKISQYAVGCNFAAPAPHDEEILNTVLSAAAIGDENAVREKTEALLDRFHTLLGIFSADAEFLAALGIPFAATVRILMLATICLWDGKRKIKIQNGRDSAKYFGEIYRGGESLYAVGLIDENFCLIETVELTDDDAIAARAKELNARYVICSTVIHDSNNAPSGELNQAKALSEKLERVGAKLLDRYIFFPNGRATLGLSPLANELKYRFEQKNFERDKRGF